MGWGCLLMTANIKFKKIDTYNPKTLNPVIKIELVNSTAVDVNGEILINNKIIYIQFNLYLGSMYVIGKEEVIN